MGFWKKLKSKKWFQQVAKVAPTVGAALGGPFAGMALNVVASALGVDPTEAAIEHEISQNPDALLKLKTAEMELKVKMRELDITIEDLHGQDRRSAREMHMALRDKTPFVLATYILSAFTALAGVILWGLISQNLVIDPAIEKFLYFLFGAVSGWVTQVISFYFGSSKGSMLKTIEQTEALRGYMDR